MYLYEMNMTLYERIKNCSAHRKPREENRDFIFEKPEYLHDLIVLAFDYQDQNSHRACWILELVADEKLEWLQLHLDFFCDHLENLKDESAIRPIAKICQLLVTAHYKKGNYFIELSEKHLKKITEVCFDWLISETKVAAKAYSMRTLYILGKHSNWIHPELKIIIDKDYQYHSPAYKVVAREILKKIG